MLKKLLCLKLGEKMRLEKLQELYQESALGSLFEIKIEKDYPDKRFSAIRLKQNIFRLRSFELWESNDGNFYRIYHGQVPSAIKSELNSRSEKFRSTNHYTDFKGNDKALFSFFYDLFSSDASKKIANANQVLTKNSAYEGLVLPDVDVTDDDVLGVVFTWKEIIAISEENSEENKLKKKLSQSGVYLQRSGDGVARYVGSAYGDCGILGRWLKHLNSNGDAKHLNLYVLENGYNNLVFSVLEFISSEDALNAETCWKQTLGTKNTGLYDGVRLNRN
jgi:hypothetical protein